MSHRSQPAKDHDSTDVVSTGDGEGEVADNISAGGDVAGRDKVVQGDEVRGDKIRHMTKVWNADHSLRQLGWA